MNNREIKIGNKSYKNKTEALKCYKKILDKYNSGTSVDDNDMDLLIDLINYDPESVNFEMEEFEEDLEPLIIHDIYVDFHPVYKKTKCFFADLGDEQWLFSYRLMINGDLSEDKKFYIACRNAVKNDLHKFKEKVFTNKPVKCAISNIEVDWDTCQIDHKSPLTFSVIVRSFIDARKIEDVMKYISYEGSIWRFIDDEMKMKFVDFHKKMAVLRTLSIEHNLKNASAGRIKPTKGDYKL